MERIYLVISMNNLGNVAHVNTWAFTSREKADEFIVSGAGDWVSDSEYAVRELAVDDVQEGK